MHVEFEVLTPTALLPGNTHPREAFDRVWRPVDFRGGDPARSWRGCWSVDDAEDFEVLLRLPAREAPPARARLWLGR